MDTQKGHPDTERRKWLWGVLPNPFGAALGPPKERGAMTGKPIRPIMKKLVGMVALGALVIAGTALHFAPGPTGESSSPSSSEKTIADSRFTDIDAVDNYLSVDDLRKYVYTEEPIGTSSNAGRSSTVDRTLSNIELERMDYEADMMLRAAAHNSSESSPFSNREIERLETHIDRLLADAALDPSRNTPQLNREIERLDDQIDALRLDTMPDTSGVRPLSNLRAIERLEEQISIMLFNAAQAGKPLSNKEIERLYAQVDRMLAAEAQDRSGYSPSSSEQSGTWLSDTKYYLDPDYRVEAQQN